MSQRTVEWILMLYNAWQDAKRDGNEYEAKYYRERWQEAIRNQ